MQLEKLLKRFDDLWLSNDENVNLLRSIVTPADCSFYRRYQSAFVSSLADLANDMIRTSNAHFMMSLGLTVECFS